MQCFGGHGQPTRMPGRVGIGEPWSRSGRGMGKNPPANCLVENGFLRHPERSAFCNRCIHQVDVQHPLAFVKTVHRVDHHAIGVFAVRTRLGDDMGHRSSEG